MESVTLTTNEAIAAGGILGGMAATIAVIGLVFWILLIIANWKIFKKAGEAGWKSIIPIYNIYIFCKIIKINFWIFMLLIPVILGVFSAIFANNETMTMIVGIATGIYTLVLDIWISIRLAKAFKKGIGFTIGLIIFPNIFQLILGFGSAKYDKKALED